MGNSHEVQRGWGLPLARVVAWGGGRCEQQRRLARLIYSSLSDCILSVPLDSIPRTLVSHGSSPEAGPALVWGVEAAETEARLCTFQETRPPF